MYGFNFELDDFQKEAIEHIRQGKSVVVCAPTGAGKTCIAQSAIHLAIENNERIFYTTPLKALSNQKKVMKSSVTTTLNLLTFTA